MSIDLSILIPARNEEWLGLTVEDILRNIEGNTEIIVVLDGFSVPIPTIPNDPRVTIVRHAESIGQRAATNEAARLARGKYLMKVDAHVAFDKGFDVKMLEAFKEVGDNATMAPLMKNFHIFDLVCKKCGTRRYQGKNWGYCVLPDGKTKNPDCDGTDEDQVKDVVWNVKHSPSSFSYLFDPEPHFYYFGSFEKRPECRDTEINETMSLQGSCFMCTKQKYFELDLCSEEFGSWGSLGIEVACKMWLSGGRVMINRKTWYAHMFRTQGGSFGFPYHLSGSQTAHAKKLAKELFFGNKWPKAIRPLSWLVEKFWPVERWTDEDLATLKSQENHTKITQTPPKSQTWGVVYYTDNKLDPVIMKKCQNALKGAVGDHRIINVSLKSNDFGENIVLPLERGYLALAKQILAGLEALDTDYVFLAEHDVIYRSEHFEFVPPDNEHYFYNTNVWHVRTSDGHGIYYDCKQQAELCANRELLVKHYRERVRRIGAEGYTMAMGFEPGSHNRPERIDDIKAEGWQSKWPNIDLRHDGNLTPSRWKQDEFRDQRNCQNWKEADNIPGWGHFSYFWKKL